MLPPTGFVRIGDCVKRQHHEEQNAYRDDDRQRQSGVQAHVLLQPRLNSSIAVEFLSEPMNLMERPTTVAA
jgi:hypothetical protein